MGYNLFLDDERKPGDVRWTVLPNVTWEIVRNYDEFVKTITSFGVPDFVAFDHDLADAHYVAMLKEVEATKKDEKFTFWMESEDVEYPGLNLTFDYGPEKTGYDCAKWLVDFCCDRGVKFPKYVVHSLNPVGAERIRHYIENAKKHLAL